MKRVSRNERIREIIEHHKQELLTAGPRECHEYLVKLGLRHGDFDEKPSGKN